MSTRTPPSDLNLNLLGEASLGGYLQDASPTFKSLKKKQNLITLTFEQTTIILPLTSTMTWGQLTDSLKEKGLIP